MVMQCLVSVPIEIQEVRKTTRSGNDNWTDGFFNETFLPSDPFKDEGEAMSEDSQAWLILPLR